MILFLDAQEWNDTSEKKMAYQLILHYEKAMIEKLNKNFFSALNLVNEVIESQLNAKSKHDLETIPHQLFTFGKASTYAELQIYLIRSRLGKPDIFDGKEIVTYTVTWRKNSTTSRGTMDGGSDNFQLFDILFTWMSSC